MIAGNVVRFGVSDGGCCHEPESDANKCSLFHVVFPNVVVFIVVAKHFPFFGGSGFIVVICKS